ncbi:hypothetical protein BGZ60DRAFT_566017 [Tricladium varicosporioides]|nr:hypothetical protein BGZ60DRAFT_566017 [Hymenoscyphus varicosporioides]
MDRPENQDMENINAEYGELDQYTCLQCFKTISSSRRPVYNSDNCSCVEAAMASNGGGHNPPSPPYGQTFYRQETSTHMNLYQPESYASSSHSVPCPEGPENAQPNITLANNYLPLAPEMGHNEAEHRRSFSFNSDMTYQMRRFLVEQQNQEHARPPTPSPNHFLSQEVHLQSQNPLQAAQSSKKSIESKKSMQSSGSGETSYIGWPTDPIMAMGAWANDSYNYEYADPTYPMTMSGMSECPFDE